MLTFEIKNGHAVVTGYELSATAEQLSHVEIPARYKLLFKVTEIGPKAFCGCTQIESIVLPDTITTIGDSAFLCSSLRWIGCGSKFEDKGNGISYIVANTIGKRAFAIPLLRMLFCKRQTTVWKWANMPLLIIGS